MWLMQSQFLPGMAPGLSHSSLSVLLKLALCHRGAAPPVPKRSECSAALRSLLTRHQIVRLLNLKALLFAARTAGVPQSHLHDNLHCKARPLAGKLTSLGSSTGASLQRGPLLGVME